MRLIDAGRRARVAKHSALVAIALTAGIFGTIRDAHAAYVLDTGTPTGSTSLTLSTAQSLAGEFSLTAGETVTGLSAYLKTSTGNGTAFEFEIFSGSGFIGGRNLSPLTTVQGTASGTAGWDSVTTNWVAPTTGNYWLALVAPTTGTTFSVQNETSTTTGSVPALGFAYSSGGQYKALGSGIGLQVNAVPLPGAVWLMLSGLGGIGVLGRKRRLAA